MNVSCFKYEHIDASRRLSIEIYSLSMHVFYRFIFAVIRAATSSSPAILIWELSCEWGQLRMQHNDVRLWWVATPLVERRRVLLLKHQHFFHSPQQQQQIHNKNAWHKSRKWRRVRDATNECKFSNQRHYVYDCVGRFYIPAAEQWGIEIALAALNDCRETNCICIV